MLSFVFLGFWWLGLPKPPKFKVCEFPPGVHELFDFILYCCAFDIHLVRRLNFATRKRNLAVFANAPFEFLLE